MQSVHIQIQIHSVPRHLYHPSVSVMMALGIIWRKKDALSQKDPNQGSDHLNQSFSHQSLDFYWHLLRYFVVSYFSGILSAVSHPMIGLIHWRIDWESGSLHLIRITHQHLIEIIESHHHPLRPVLIVDQPYPHTLHHFMISRPHHMKRLLNHQLMIVTKWWLPNRLL